METGYTFKDSKLRDSALTHPSASKKKDVGRIYERLEFLGDRVLGLVIAEWVYALYPNADEGELARRHTALVRRDALVSVAEAVGLPAAIKAGTQGRASVLADTLEALLGAMFLDGGLKPVEKFIRTHFLELSNTKTTNDRDPKTALQEWAQARKMAVPKYTLESRAGPAHAPMFTVSATVGREKPLTATGTTKQDAEKAAAAALLKQVQKSK